MSNSNIASDDDALIGKSSIANFSDNFDTAESSIRSNTSSNTIQIGENSIQLNVNPEIYSITQDARQFVNNLNNDDQKKQALEILIKIEKILLGNNDLKLPKIEVEKGADETINIDWKINNSRLGLIIDKQPRDSTWFLLIGEKQGAMRAYGNLYDEIQVNTLLDTLVSLLRKTKNQITN